MILAALMLQFAGPLDVAGVWETGNGRAHVEIAETADGSIRGQIIWYASYEQDLAEGRDTSDTILGKVLLEDFVRSDDKWRRGKIHDLRNDRTYRSALSRSDADTISVEGCLAVFCRAQQWTRVPPDQQIRLQPTD
ncbi:MAG: DUF2147 domain-containing protein [Pseudomonadota bacterium]